MKKRKLKKKVKRILLLTIFIIIFSIFSITIYKNYNYKKTYEYKFLNLSYSLNEYEIIKNKLNNNELEKLLNLEYNENTSKIINEKYFMFKNFDRYLSYLDENPNTSIKDVISLVNVNRDRDYYKDMENTDINKGTSMLVNKYHALTSDYKPENIVKTSSTYSYANNSLNEEAYNAFKNLAEDAKKEGHTILILSSYRTYDDQKNLWDARKKAYGTRKADEYAARPGSSEHETGLAIDVADYYDKNDKFGETESFKWMINNCYKYGFILRYPEGKEDITGYSYEPWHYRYLGIELATKVYNEQITFDEYYEFYLNK